MKRDKTEPSLALADGQLWQLENSYIQVFHVGRRLVNYKVMKKLKQRAVRTHTTAIGTLEKFLKDNSARLTSPGATN